MKKRRSPFARHWKLFGVPIAVIWCLPQVAFSAESDIDARHKAMQYLAEFAESICASVKQSGDVTKTLKSADLKADLSGLTRKLADVGFEVKGAKSQDSFEGVAQADLPRVLESTANCKLKVIERFGDQLTRVSSSSREKARREPKPKLAGDPVIDRVEAPVKPAARPDVGVSDAGAGDAHPGTGALADTIWALRFEPAIIPPWDHCPGAQIKLVADHTMGGRCTPKDQFVYFSTSTWNQQGAGLEFTFQNGWKYQFPTEPMSGRDLTATSPADPSPNKLIVHLKYVGRE